MGEENEHKIQHRIYTTETQLPLGMNDEEERARPLLMMQDCLFSLCNRTWDCSLNYSPLKNTFKPYLWPVLTVLARWDCCLPTLLLGSSFSEAFGRHFCEGSPKYTCRLDCVGATSVIAYLVSNYPCLSHSQPTQALIEFLSLWVMSYLS